MAPDDVFHPVLEVELPLLHGDFFDLLGFGKVVLVGQFVEAGIELVVRVPKRPEVGI